MKVMQISQFFFCYIVELMVCVLCMGNYSVVIGWLVDDLIEEEYVEFVDAVNEGNVMGFIMCLVSVFFYVMR